MVKKILGVIATLAILALIVFTALGFGSYKSMLPESWFDFGAEQGSVVIEESAEPAVTVEEADSVAIDSISGENVEVAAATEASEE